MSLKLGDDAVPDIMAMLYHLLTSEMPCAGGVQLPSAKPNMGLVLSAFSSSSPLGRRRRRKGGVRTNVRTYPFVLQ